MFEIGTPKKEKKEGEFEFDIEKDIKDEKFYNSYTEEISAKVREIEKMRREGGSKEEMEKFDLLLAGYQSVQEILKTAKQKQK